MADPTHHLQVSVGEHRGQDALQERLARLAVVSHVASFSIDRQFANRGRRRAERGSEVDVWIAEFHGGDGVERAGRQRARVNTFEQRFEIGPALRQLAGIDRRFGGCHIDDDHFVELISRIESLQVLLHAANCGTWHFPRFAQLSIGKLRDRWPDIEQDSRANIGVNSR